MKYLMALLFAAVIVFPLISVADLSLKSDSSSCRVKIISTVVIVFEGDNMEYLNSKRDDLKQLVRLRLRNDLSMMSHEDLSYFEVRKKYGVDRHVSEIKERGHVDCTIWTVGESSPIAYHVQCVLGGYGAYFYDGSLSRFEEATLGYTSRERLYEGLNDALRMIIEGIANDFLKDRERYCSN